MLRLNPNNPCELQESNDGGITWQTIIDLSPCKQDKGQVTQTNDTYHQCAGAAGLIDWLTSILNYNLDQIDTVVGPIENVVEDVIDYLSAKAKDIRFTVVASFLEGIKNVGTGIIRTPLNDPGFRETILQLLYCRVSAAGGFNEIVFNDWLNNLPNRSSLVYPSRWLADLAENIVGYAICSERFNVYAQDTNVECGLFECEADSCTLLAVTEGASATWDETREKWKLTQTVATAGVDGPDDLYEGCA